jgi:L-lactate dehydrogenase complex protein LldG
MRHLTRPSGEKPRTTPRQMVDEIDSSSHVPGHEDPVERFGRELEDIGGVFIRCEEGEVPRQISSRLRDLGVNMLLAWGEGGLIATLIDYLRKDGFEVLEPDLPRGASSDRYARLAELGIADAGLTGAVAGIAETGTMVLPVGTKRSQLASLLPPVHFAILRAEDIYRTMEEWLAASGKEQMAGTACMNLISGPSRTADIEMTLTIGVHGPCEVVVYCLD